jgi:hypothetical protein
VGCWWENLHILLHLVLSVGLGLRQMFTAHLMESFLVARVVYTSLRSNQNNEITSVKVRVTKFVIVQSLLQVTTRLFLCYLENRVLTVYSNIITPYTTKHPYFLRWTANIFQKNSLQSKSGTSEWVAASDCQLSYSNTSHTSSKIVVYLSLFTSENVILNETNIQQRSDVLIKGTVKNVIFWDVTQYGSCNTRRFGGMHCLHQRDNWSTLRASVASYS